MTQSGSIHNYCKYLGVATRYDKRALNYRVTVTIAALMIWLTDSSATP